MTISKDKILSGITLDDKFRGQHKLIHHLPDYHIVWNKGIETLKLGSGYPGYQINRKVSRDILPHPNWNIGKDKVYWGRYNNSDYLLFRGNINDFRNEESKKIILNNFEIFRKRNEWAIYKNKKN